MNSAGKSYVLNILGAGVAYGLLLVVSILVLTNTSEGAWRYLVAILPVLPAFWGLMAFVRFLG